jgi:hypothetical protein
MKRTARIALAALLIVAAACHRNSKEAQLKALDEAYKSGVFTKEEYDAKKQALVGTPALRARSPARQLLRRPPMLPHRRRLPTRTRPAGALPDPSAALPPPDAAPASAAEPAAAGLQAISVLRRRPSRRSSRIRPPRQRRQPLQLGRPPPRRPGSPNPLP